MSSSAARAQAQDSRDEILKAATGLFAGRGFHETSMSEVAREARVSKALIFWHFKTKEELFLAVLNGLLAPYFIDFAEEAAALSEPDQILKLVEMYLSFVRDNASSVRFFIVQLLHGERLSDALTDQVLRLYDGYRSLLIDLVRRAQEKELCARDFTPEAAVGFLLSALNGTLVERLFMGNSAIDTDSAVAMLRGWLFHDAAHGNHGGSQAVN
jgi:TetR/AcrR family transcriptional repressor of acrEF/envCD operon